MKNRIWLSGLVAGAVAMAGAVALTTASASAQMGTSSTQTAAKVGQKAPDFTLTDIEGKEHKLSDYIADGKVVVLEWWNPGCPFVVRHHDDENTMSDLAGEYKDDNVVWLAINSTNKSHGDYGKDAKAVADWDVEYPVLLDESGKVGRMYGAKTTPHMYVIGKDGILHYAGAIDNDPRGRMDASERVNYVKQALDEILAGETVTTAETNPYGCSVKYGS